MIALPSGRYIAGSGADEHRHEGLAPEMAMRESPQRPVSVGAFALGKTEVTRAQYRAFARATNRPAGDGCWSWHVERDWVKDPAMNWQNPGFEQDDLHPVVCVTWSDAEAYVAWLAARTGKAYRLPSEAEWEYAARAGAETTRPWGDGLSEMCLQENISDYGHRLKYRIGAEDRFAFVCADGQAETAPAGSFRPNTFGLLDMLGNVFEWTADCWNETHQGAPGDGRPRLTGDCETRVRKGGSWMSGAETARPAFRDRNTIEGRGNMLGFRVALSLGR